MTEEKYLQVKRSTLPGSGKGLFTSNSIRKGTRIVEYKGKVITWKEASEQKGFNGYIYYITRNRVIDAKRHIKARARYANDARGIIRMKGILNNSRYVVDHDHVYIEAARDIPAGSEILVGYGKEYWDIVKQNKSLTKK